MKNHILFVHLPKTAGTSFRIAAEIYFKKENTYYDYGETSGDTSDEIRKIIYNNNDFYALYQSLRTRNQSFLSGHFGVNKYAHIHDTLSIVSFVREPAAQVISHYNHYCAYYGYTKTLKEFIHEPRFQNIQSKYLHGMPISLYGFIGITERYNDSLELFNHMFKTDLRPMHLNSTQTDSLALKTVDKAILKHIEKINTKDTALYDNAKKQFNIQYALYKKDLPFTYGIIQKNEHNHIIGFAYQHNKNKLVEIDIYNGEKYLDTCKTTEFKPGLVSHQLPRKGYVGFDYRYRGESKELHLRAIVKETGQEIFSHL